MYLHLTLSTCFREHRCSSRATSALRNLLLHMFTLQSGVVTSLRLLGILGWHTATSFAIMPISSLKAEVTYSACFVRSACPRASVRRFVQLRLYSALSSLVTVDLNLYWMSVVLSHMGMGVLATLAQFTAQSITTILWSVGRSSWLCMPTAVDSCATKPSDAII